jgi:hypothetical protein
MCILTYIFVFILVYMYMYIQMDLIISIYLCNYVCAYIYTFICILYIYIGDDGANTRDYRSGGSGSCGYVMSFPASSPYVTAIGATQGVFFGD